MTTHDTAYITRITKEKGNLMASCDICGREYGNSAKKRCLAGQSAEAVKFPGKSTF